MTKRRIHQKDNDINKEDDGDLKLQQWTNVQPHKMQQTVAVRKKCERNYMVK